MEFLIHNQGSSSGGRFSDFFFKTTPVGGYIGGFALLNQRYFYGGVFFLHDLR